MVENGNHCYMSRAVSMSDLLTVKDTMKLLRISRPTVYQLLKNKKIISFLFAGKYLIERASLLEYLLRGRYATRQTQGNSCALDKQKECAVYE